MLQMQEIRITSNRNNIFNYQNLLPTTHRRSQNVSVSKLICSPFFERLRIIRPKGLLPARLLTEGIALYPSWSACPPSEDFALPLVIYYLHLVMRVILLTYFCINIYTIRWFFLPVFITFLTLEFWDQKSNFSSRFPRFNYKLIIAYYKLIIVNY